MSAKILKTAAMAAAFCLAGCETMGNGHAFKLTQGNLAQSVSIGQSKAADIRREFGDASVYRLANGYEIWTYRKTDGVPGFVDYVPVVGLFTPLMPRHSSEVAFLFDTHGVLRNVDLRNLDNDHPETAGNTPPHIPESPGEVASAPWTSASANMSSTQR